MSAYVGNDDNIIIEFDKPLDGDVTGKVGIPFGYKSVKLIDFTSTANDSGRGAVSNAFDENTGTYWGTSATLPNWISITFTEAKLTNKFRVYLGASYRPRAFQFQGSNDNATWVDIVIGEFPNVAQWNEYTYTEISYQYYRLYITSRWSSYTYVYELEIYEAIVIGNERAFTVSAQEKDPLEIGEYKTKTYEVIGVERYQKDIHYNTTDTWNAGTFSNTEVVNNALQLTTGSSSGSWMSQPLNINKLVGMVLDNNLTWEGTNLTELINNEIVKNVTVQTAITGVETISQQIGVGDGATRTFNIPNLPDENANDLKVFINGVEVPSTDYTVDKKKILFSVAPLLNDVVSVVYTGIVEPLNSDFIDIIDDNTQVNSNKIVDLLSNNLTENKYLWLKLLLSSNSLLPTLSDLYLNMTSWNWLQLNFSPYNRFNNAEKVLFQKKMSDYLEQGTFTNTMSNSGKLLLQADYDDTTLTNYVTGKQIYASSIYSSYYPSNLIDGNTSTYFRPNTNVNEWVYIDLGEPKVISKFRWYNGNNYRINEFILQASDDAQTWVDIVTNSMANTTGWNEFIFDYKIYRYWRVYLISAWSSYLYCYEMELLGGQLINYVNSGNWIISLPVSNLIEILSSNIQYLGTFTDVNVNLFTTISDNKDVQPVTWIQNTNNTSLATINIGDNLYDKYLWLKVELNSNDMTQYLSDLVLNIYSNSIDVDYNQSLGSIIGEKNAVVIAFLDGSTRIGLIKTPVGFSFENINSSINNLSIDKYKVNHILVGTYLPTGHYATVTTSYLWGDNLKPDEKINFSVSNFTIQLIDVGIINP